MTRMINAIVVTLLLLATVALPAHATCLIRDTILGTLPYWTKEPNHHITHWWWEDVNGDFFMDFIYMTSKHSAILKGNELHVLLSSAGKGLTAFERDKPSPNNPKDGIANVNNIWMADVNGDGRSDVIYSPASDPTRYSRLLGQRDGTFFAETQMGQRDPKNNIAWSGDVQWWGDVNNDGSDDLVYNSNNSYEYWVKPSDKNGKFRLLPDGKPDEASWGKRKHPGKGYAASQWLIDVDGNDYSDFVYGNERDYYALLAQPDDRFAEEIIIGSRKYGLFSNKSYSGMYWPFTSEWWADVNGDGNLDLIYVSESRQEENQRIPPQFRVLPGAGGGKLRGEEVWGEATFDEPRLYTYVKFADMNADGAADLMYQPSNKSPNVQIQLSLISGFSVHATTVKLSQQSFIGPKALVLGHVSGNQRRDLVYLTDEHIKGTLSCMTDVITLTYDEVEQGYYLPLKMGANPISVLLDTGSANLLVVGPDCVRCNQNGEDCNKRCRGTVYRESDKTCTKPYDPLCIEDSESTRITIEYDDGTLAEATRTCDSVELQDRFPGISYAFGVIQKTHGDVSNILGLGYKNDAVERIPPLLPCMIQELKFPRNVFELCMDRGDKKGHLALGDPTYSSAEYGYFDVEKTLVKGKSDYVEYNIRVSYLAGRGMSILDDPTPIGYFESKDIRGLALVDSGTTDLVLPSDLYDSTVTYLTNTAKRLGATVRDGEDPLTVVLGQTPIDLFPSLFIITGSRWLELDPSSLWHKESEKEYSLKISKTNDKNAILGLPFMENFYTVFDVSSEPNRIGFAARTSLSCIRR